MLLIGSEYKAPESFFAQVASNNPAAEEFIWNKICSSDAGASGAAWDELIANDDRHHENALFDGENWWFFDHDRALLSAGPFSRSPGDATLRLELANFRAKCNLLAEQMVIRRRNSHGIFEMAAEFDKYKADLAVLANAAARWSHSDAKINEILTCTGILLSAIQLRLPPLAEHLQTRIAQPSAESLWE